MKKFGAYFKAQLKRICRVLPFVVAISLALVGCMLLLALALQQSDAESEKKQKVKIGLAGDTSAGYLGFGIMALQKLDVSKFAIDFINMSEEEAKKQLQAGELSAYLVIPEGFVEALDRGDEIQIEYATVNDAAGVSTLIMNELVLSISDIVEESQNAIWGTWRLMWQYGAPGDMAEISDTLYLRFVSMFLNRTVFYRVMYTGVSDGLSLSSYYFVGITVLFMLLWGITGSSLFVKRDMALPKLLKSRGQSCAVQIMAEYLAYFLLMLGSTLLMLLPVGTAMNSLGIRIPGWEEPVAEVLLFGVKMIPVIALLAALQFLLYELISDTISGIILQFLVGCGLGYLSGCIYPVTFFPESIQRVAPFLPTYAAMQYGAGCMQDELAGKALGIMMLYLLLFLALSVGLRERRAKA